MNRGKGFLYNNPRWSGSYDKSHLLALILCKRVEEVLDLIQQREIPFSRNDAYYLLQDCTHCAHLNFGRRVNFLMIQSSIDSVAVLGDHLIRLFASCGCLIESNQILNRVVLPSAYTWSSIIWAQANLGHAYAALEMYARMQLSGVKCDRCVYLSVLKACMLIPALEHGRHVHQQILHCGLQLDLILCNSVLDMYAKCGSLHESERVFDGLQNADVVSWGAMIDGYVQHGEGYLAFDCFQKMQQKATMPNNIVYLSMLKGCATMRDIYQGRLIHSLSFKGGFDIDTLLGNALVDMYAKCGDFDGCQRAFSRLGIPDVVSWNIYIVGCAQHGEGLLGLSSFDRMKEEGIQPDKVTFLNLLKACSVLGILEQARLIHEHILVCGFEKDVVISNTIIDMYAKCGSLDESSNVFNQLANRNVVSWNVLIAGYAQYGDYSFALACFERMKQEHLKPDGVTFLCIIVACSRAGLVDKGHWYFFHMKDFNIMPDMNHYISMVDLLSRAGLFREAEDLLQATGQLDLFGWRSLLHASRIHGNADQGKHFFDKLVHLHPFSSLGYVLMSDLYAYAHLFEGDGKYEAD